MKIILRKIQVALYNENDFLVLFDTSALCLLVAVGSSGILKAKQKLGVTFNSDKQDVIDFKKFSKLKMCTIIKN